MEFVALASSFSGHSFKLKAEDFIFHIPLRSFQILDWKYLSCVQQEVFGVFILPYFVLSWYILARRLIIKTVPKWKYFFPFSICKWHIIVQINRNNKLFLKDEHSYKQSSFGVIFFQGLHITCKTYYNLSIKAENYLLD